MSTVARVPAAALEVRRWKDPAVWATTADVFVILIAVSLPWSTSLVAIFAAALLVAMVPLLDPRAFVQSLKRPICALPIALFLLAVVGTLWSDAPWGARLYAAEGSAPQDFSRNGWVVEALQTAWCAITTAVYTDGKLMYSLQHAVRGGRDADTVAAIAGGLLGAACGASAVPDAWRSLLHGWPGFGARDLVRLASGIVGE